MIAGGIILGIVLLVGGIAFLVKKKPSEAKTITAAAMTTTIPVQSTRGESPEKLYQQAAGLRSSGKLAEAKQIYQAILMNHPDYKDITLVQNDLWQINTQLITTNAESPRAVIHNVEPGDTLGKIAKKYGTTVDLIRKRNNVKGDTIRVGQRFSVWTGTFNIFVDKSQDVLLLKDGDEVLKTYRVSTGENNSTPVGTFTITSKLIDPVWFNRGVVVPPDSPANVLGTRWLGFDMPGYGIHGTIEPQTIGQQITAGCVRMRNEEVEELYSIVPLGTKVTIVN